LSLVYIAEDETGRYIDAYQIYLATIKSGTIGADCYVNSPTGLLNILTGHTWAVSKEAPEYVCKPGEREVLRYEWQETSTLHGHFVVGDSKGGIEYDPFPSCGVVANGKLVSKRIFRRVA
jgi:hypothetical protein